MSAARVMGSWTRSTPPGICSDVSRPRASSTRRGGSPSRRATSASSALLVGNFGNGRIHAFDPAKLNGQGEFQHRGPLHSADGPPIAIDGLWAIAFGSDAPNNGPTNTLFFTAGPFDESHGLFGS